MSDEIARDAVNSETIIFDHCLARFFVHIRGMSARYDITNKISASGWSVYDTWTNMPVEIDGYVQTEMPLEEADDLADLLNHLHSEKISQSRHH